MALINPITIAAATGAAKAVATAIPKHYLGRVGLVKAAPLLAPLPMVVGGAAALGVALAIPKSRSWLLAKSSAAYDAARGLAPQTARPSADEGADSPSDASVASEK